MADSIQVQLSQFCLGWAQKLGSHDALPPGARIYHYTSKAGMRAILASRHLRAYHILEQTDYTEVRYAASRLRSRIDRRYAFAEDEKEAELYGALRQTMRQVGAADIFVLSFSDGGVRDPMWRLYAERGTGFSFCIPIPHTEKWPGLSIVTRCNYDTDAHATFFDSSLDRLAELYRAAVTAGRAEPLMQYAEQYFANIAWFATMFKSREYEHEQEWRLVFRRPKEFHRRDEHGRLFIEVPGSAFGPLQIEAICAGPRCAPDTLQDVQQIANANGYGQVPFHICDKPTA